MSDSITLTEFQTFYASLDLKEEENVIKVFKTWHDFNEILGEAAKTALYRALQDVGWSVERILEMETWAWSKWKDNGYVKNMLESKGEKVNKVGFML